MTLDIRKKTVAAREDKEEARRIFNYILEKARKLAEAAGIEEGLRGKLAELAKTYEEALRKGDEEAIEKAEDLLLEKIEEAEEVREEES